MVFHPLFSTTKFFEKVSPRLSKPGVYDPQGVGRQHIFDLQFVAKGDFLKTVVHVDENGLKKGPPCRTTELQSDHIFGQNPFEPQPCVIFW